MIPNILAFSGVTGSGKSTISLKLANVLECKYASFGNYVRKYAIRMGHIDTSRNQLQAVGEMLVNTSAKEFCLSVLQDADWIRGERVIIDGIRHSSVLETLRGICYPQEILLIYVMIDKNIRTQRLMHRGRGQEPSLSDYHSTEVQVHEILRAKADLIIDAKNSIIENVNKIVDWLKLLE